MFTLGPKELKLNHLLLTFPPTTGTVTNQYRQARKFLCKQLGITMKQLRKRRVLRDYRFRNGVYLKIEVV